MKYRTIVADPPWPGDWWPFAVRAGRRTPKRYGLMTLEEIEALPVASISAEDANLFLWIPSSLNREGVGARVARAWGFDVLSEIVWEKPKLGHGRFPRACHEILLVCSRGAFTLAGPWNVRSVQRWSLDFKAGTWHSAKPDGAIDLIEQHSPGPYVELFARRHRFNWDVWGDQSANTAEMAAVQ